MIDGIGPAAPSGGSRETRNADAASRAQADAARGTAGSNGARAVDAAFDRAPASAGVAQLSPLARDMAAGPPVDADKVGALRDAIIRGDYRADPMAIAARMLALEPPLAG